MSSVVLSGDTSGTITVTAPLVAGSSTQTLAAVTGTLAPVVSGTAVSVSGTSVTFSSIPSWVKRITVMFNGVSTSGTSNYQIQLGIGSTVTSGYSSSATNINSAPTTVTATSGFILTNGSLSTDAMSGIVTIAQISSNTYVASGYLSRIGGNVPFSSAGTINSLGGTLDRVRITTVNGTDTFDAGSINILYE